MATDTGTSSQTETKRTQYEALIRRCFIQLTEGCGIDDCTNPNCATGSGNRMDQNTAAAKALTIVHKNKKLKICLPQERLSSFAASSKNLLGKSLPVTGSASSTSSECRDAYEAMETADSIISGSAESSKSSEGAASSTLIQMRSDTSGDREGSPPPLSQAISDYEPSSSSGGESGSVDSIVISTSHSSDLVAARRIPSMSTISSSEIVGMDLSPSIPSGQTFKVPHLEDAIALPLPIMTSDLNIPEPPILTEELVQKLIEQGQNLEDTNFRELTNQIWLVFSNPDALNKSFLLPEEEVSEIGKETGIKIDLQSLRRTYEALFNVESERVKNTVSNAMEMYRGYLQRQKAFKTKENLTHFVVLLENPLLASPEFLKCYPKLLRAVITLPVPQKELLIRWYSHYPTKNLINFIRSLQQLITLQLLFSDESEHSRHYLPQSDPSIAAASGAMGIFYFANLLKAKSENNMKPFSSSLNSFVAKAKPEFMQSSDTDYEQLILRLQVHPCLVKSFPIPLSEFINDELNRRIDMTVDYQREYSSTIGEKSFSFLEHPYMLNVTNKVEKLYRDNLVSMFSERHRAVIHSVLTGVADIPFLVLRINRDKIVEDALVQLEATAELNPIDLRKQLRIEFYGEEGVDEGGLQKEFFQLIIEKLFDPVYGLFVYNESTQQHWINPSSFESDGEYQLIGLLLGLAIYNNIILDIRFPMVIYRKLLGCPIDFTDLSSSHPVIAQSLQSLLDFNEEPEKFQESFMINFEVSYLNMFGNEYKHELKENGKNIVVTMNNRQEFVDLYTDWLLNTSIDHKLKAFRQGFNLVMSQSCLADLVIAEDLELIICGSTEWDIDALEESTRYDGFSPRQQVIMNFWQIVRDFSDSQRKKLLAFITGSDRIPLGGLSKLKLIIVKNGPDSNRLPTAHTCFNALLLCEYSTKERLRDRLVKAISNSKGFGMI